MALAIHIGSAVDLPFRAPHLVDAVLADARGAPEVHATLDRRLQALLERQIRGYVAAQARLGVHNAAAMLVDSRTMAVKALVGSADFFDRGIAGQVNMEELVALYGALANDGIVRPVRYREDQPMAAGVRVLSPEASYVTREILKDNPRPGDLTAATPGPLSVYWKTGTSYGFRDAWTVGMFGPYILAIWVGNFDGSGNPAFVGVQMAAPLFFQVVDAVEAMEPSLAEPVRTFPAGLTT